VQVDEVKNIMVDNIEKVLERGEKIELLVDKTDNLRFQVQAYSCQTCSSIRVSALHSCMLVNYICRAHPRNLLSCAPVDLFSASSRGLYHVCLPDFFSMPCQIAGCC